MKYIFYITGKSASGKDSIYRELLSDKTLNLNPLILHTTRPKRDGETDDMEYHFVDEGIYQDMKKKGEVIECRTYDTMHGPWRYFTSSSAVETDKDFYLGIGTLESFRGLKDYFGADSLIPLYIEVEDGDRLIRAIEREKLSNKPDYREMCRRYIADDEDFSELRLQEADIDTHNRFENRNLTDCISDIRSMIIGYQSK